jgi:hypothetical protein
MKAKLIKQNGIGIQTLDGVDYYLILDGKIYHTNPLTSDLSGGGKLSKQNCDEIFGVVDVEKLAQMDIHNVKPINPHPHSYFSGFIRGFNKAMELYQPTEIDVEVEMEKVVDETKMVGAVKGVKGSGDKITTYKTVPKLDSNGCLILKQQKQ